jgi:lauroyl/myristoyl acyltransferase
MIAYLLYRISSALICVVSARCALMIATGIAWLFYITRPAVRRNVRRNYEHCGVRPRNTWPVFRNFSHAVTDFLSLSGLRGGDLMERCSITGREHLDRALAGGKGAILFAPHLGPWELAGAYLTSLGYRIHTVALEHPSERLTRYFSSLRAAWGITDYPSLTCAGSLMRALGRGEPVVLLVDRNFSRRGFRTRFLGEETLVAGGHAVLSLRTGAPLLPCCAHYVAENRIECIIGPPVESAASPQSAAAMVAACLERLEAFIRRNPDQWFAFDHVWRVSRDD